jgi:hypothetical protein
MGMTQGPGWYPDPFEPRQQRWHDGRRLTGVTRPDPAIGHAAVPTRRRTAGRGRSLGTVALVLVAGVVAVGATYVRAHHGSAEASTMHRLLPRVHPRSDSLNYAILNTGPKGRPIAYNPCRPIEYVVNPDGAPADYLSFIKPAVKAAQRASGLKFVYLGTTTETVERSQRATTPEPVVIAFPAKLAVSKEVKRKEDVVGLGGSTWVTENGVVQPHYLTGSVALLSGWFKQQSAQHNRVAEQSVVMHEVGHLLGLDHVEDPAQIMYPAYHGQAAYGPGDLAGLAVEGSSAC